MCKLGLLLFSSLVPIPPESSALPVCVFACTHMHTLSSVLLHKFLLLEYFPNRLFLQRLCLTKLLRLVLNLLSSCPLEKQDFQAWLWYIKCPFWGPYLSGPDNEGSFRDAIYDWFQKVPCKVPVIFCHLTTQNYLRKASLEDCYQVHLWAHLWQLPCLP